ncbi:hypothetical protein BKA65DRAFT_486670 [Rhexocercosporidium sp. MPI-PUGE-AT-0058]|nr:hypothetical protein BKA65DRAFT_486670 [Rhexocercosporidium sp. MPI-PUGE-AT-0058]
MALAINSLDASLKQISVSQLPSPHIVWPWSEEQVPRSSERVHISKVPANMNIRTFYLKAVKGDNTILPPPIVSASELVPPALIEHLMRKKRSSALGEKFITGSEITNMEGAMHTFVVPIVPRCETAGDYCYSFGHRATPPITATSDEGKDIIMTRSVVMSATIHMDFELPIVMLEICRLRNEEVLGKDLNTDLTPFKILSRADKQVPALREAYDESLRRHMVFHLTTAHRLPALSDPANKVMTLETTLSFLEALINDQAHIPDQLVHRFAQVGTRTVSLELLFVAAFQVVRNEFSALEALCTQGYVYTYDPPSIFAQCMDPVVLNRLVILAIKYLSSHNQLSNLKIFGFNDYADSPALGLLKVALANQDDVVVVSKGDLFRGEDGRFENGIWKELKGKGDGGRFDIGKWPHAKGAMLVVHNNSDGFGQNVETEYLSGSLDGAIGFTSSAAGSLERGRLDLMDFVV